MRGLFAANDGKYSSLVAPRGGNFFSNFFVSSFIIAFSFLIFLITIIAPQH